MNNQRHLLVKANKKENSPYIGIQDVDKQEDHEQYVSSIEMS